MSNELVAILVGVFLLVHSWFCHGMIHRENLRQRYPWVEFGSLCAAVLGGVFLIVGFAKLAQ